MKANMETDLENTESWRLEAEETGWLMQVMGKPDRKALEKGRLTVSLDLCPVTIARKEKDLYLLKKISVSIIPWGKIRC